MMSTRQKLFPLGLALLFLAGTTLAAGKQTSPFVFPIENFHRGKTPWTNLLANNDPKNFQFVIVSDRTGGMRDDIFGEAVEDINLMQPEFVISVGDFIQGYTRDEDEMYDEWEEFNEMVQQLQMPFFYVPGNHDLSYPELLDEWEARFGPTYYSFKYHDVLFVVLNSQFIINPKDYWGGEHRKQIRFLEKTLKKAGDVRWTIVLLHHPIWGLRNSDKLESGSYERWLEVEERLKGRKYTLFAGHTHKFNLTGRDENTSYITLATTGGGSKLRGVSYGEYDHFLWVTMTDDGPIIANLLLDGVLDLHDSGL